MSLNPLFSATGQVVRMPGEYLVLSRPDCEFDLLIGSRPFKGTGSVILTSFRVVIVNTDAKTMSKWRAIDLPLPLIYNEVFEKPIFASHRFEGRCKSLDPTLEGIINFMIYMKKGTVDLVEAVYKDLVGKVRSQQYSKNLNVQFQSLLATCVYHKTEVIPKQKDDPAYVFNMQPPAYMGEHFLIHFMEKSLPGITGLEAVNSILPIPPPAPAPVVPKPEVPEVSVVDGGVMEQKPTVTEPLPKQPIPPSYVPAAPVLPQVAVPAEPKKLDSMYPEFSAVWHPGDDNYGQNIYPHVEDFKHVDEQAADPLCVKCGKSCHSVRLLCGDYIHPACISAYILDQVRNCS